MRRRAAVVGSVAFTLGVLSCQLLLDSERPRPDPDPVEASDPCDHRRPPEPPAEDDDPETKNDYWLALKSIEVPVRPDGGVHPGYDLDDSCTCQRDLFDAEPPCLTPVAAPRSTTSCDFDGGVDDALSAITGEFGALADQINPGRVINDKIETGERGLLLYVGSYNGQPNDRNVTLSFVGSPGIYTNLGCTDAPRGPARPPDGGVLAPLWDGCDRWSPFSSSLQNRFPNRIPIGTVPGYVTKNVLVAKIEIGLNLEVFGRPTSFSNGFAVLRLQKAAQGFAATGILTGRVPAAEMADILGRTEVRSGGPTTVPFCTTPLWPPVAEALCQTRDSMLSRSEEHAKGGLRVCDASTMSLAFTALPAQAADEQFDRPPSETRECPTTVTCPKPANAR